MIIRTREWSTEDAAEAITEEYAELVEAVSDLCKLALRDNQEPVEMAKCYFEDLHEILAKIGVES